MLTIIILIVFFVLYFIYFRGFKNKHGVSIGQYILYFANIGSGKSCLLARIAQKELDLIAKEKSKFKGVVSNAHIKGVWYIADPRKALQQGMLFNYLILIEEASVVYPNKSKQDITDMEREEKKMIRHYLCSMILVSQSHEDINIIIRRMYTEIWLLRPMGNVTALKRIYKEIDISEDKKISDAMEFGTWFLTNKYFYKPFYYHMFDSFYIPDYIPILDVERNMIVYSDGTEKPLEDSARFHLLESANDMTLIDKLKCNRNMSKLFESKLFTLKKGKLVMVESEDELMPKEECNTELSEGLIEPTDQVEDAS